MRPLRILENQNRRPEGRSYQRRFARGRSSAAFQGFPRIFSISASTLIRFRTPRTALSRLLGGLSSPFSPKRPLQDEQEPRDCGTEPSRIVFVEVTIHEHVSTYALRISAGRPPDLGLFASRHEAHRFLECRPRASWKSPSGNPVGVLDRERTEHGAEPVRLDAPGVHANLVYDLTKVRLAAVQHG